MSSATIEVARRLTEIFEGVPVAETARPRQAVRAEEVMAVCSSLAFCRFCGATTVGVDASHPVMGQHKPHRAGEPVTCTDGGRR